MLGGNMNREEKINFIIDNYPEFNGLEELGVVLT